MGWLFTDGATKASIVKHLTTDNEHVTTHRYSVRGNTLWAIQTAHHLEGNDRGIPPKFIACYLLQSDGSFGWGYKDMCESMGPARYDCPLSYLDEVEPPPSEFAQGWRDEVRTHHATQARRRKMFKAATVGDTVVLTESCSPNRLVLVQTGRRFAADDPKTGCRYRVPKKWIVAIGPDLPVEQAEHAD